MKPAEVEVLQGMTVSVTNMGKNYKYYFCADFEDSQMRASTNTKQFNNM